MKQLLKQFSSIYTLQDKEKRSFNTVKEMLDAMSDYDVYNGHDADARRYEDKPNHKDGKDNIYQHNNDNHIPKKENTNKQSQQSRKTPDIDFYTLTQHTIRDKLVELGIDSLFIDEFVTGAMRGTYVAVPRGPSRVMICM